MDTRTCRGFSHRRLAALSIAELRQLLANRTVLLMAALPAPLVVMIFVGLREQIGEEIAMQYVVGEFLVPFVLLLVQSYPVLSAATTRRDEKVLKRLRTGEATDAEILLSLVAPSFVLSIAMFASVSLLLVLLSASAWYNPALFLSAALLGLAFSAAAALITSSFTKNAEAAQMSALPLFTLAAISVPGIRNGVVPNQLTMILDRTPFALTYDLAVEGWLGSGAESILPMLFTLVIWVALGVWGVQRYFKWENNR